jgi:HAD superfamily hydrolase (TIGR01509 family)
VAGWAAIFGAAAGAYGMAVKRATSSTALQHHDQEEAPITPALLLDCDGTIVDTERDGHRVAFNQAFKEKGLVGVEWSVELYGELLTTGGGKERMARYFTDYNPSAWPDPTNPPAKDHPLIMDLHKLKTKLFMDIIESGSLPLRPGIQEVVDAAIAAGWQTAVCSTSNEKAVQAVVDKLLDGKIKHIFAGDMVPKKKPDPAIYNMAAQELSLDPNHCVVVEDSRIGLLAARAAGMACIVTKSTYTGGEDFTEAQLVVDDMGSTGLDKVEALIA